MDVPEIIGEAVRIQWNEYDVFLIVKMPTFHRYFEQLQDFQADLQAVVDKHFPGSRVRVIGARGGPPI